ncbi:hypothetical protein C8J57DRAFT_1708862 [Mycena rebaudengoi]|nr:hypothetical protein C8J57DRAFT_1708862 [Mycena rebaudengoi]
MSTIVERPLSVFRMSASPSLVPQRRALEVIDVDSFEPDTRPAQRRRTERTPDVIASTSDVIELLDSDSEDELALSATAGESGSSNRTSDGQAVASGSGSNSRLAQGSRRASLGVAGSSTARHRRRFFSPPPQVGLDHIPPVPPLPRRWNIPHVLIPRPRGPRVGPPPSSDLSDAELHLPGAYLPDNIPGPVRPSSRGFSIDLSGPTPPRLPRHRPDSDEDLFEFRPSPSARHNPPMGLGGALISHNNARLAAERAERARRSERRAADNNPGLLRRLASGLNVFRGSAWRDEQPQNEVDFLALARPWADDEDERTRDDAQIALDLYLRDQRAQLIAHDRRFGHPARSFAQRELALLRGYGAGGREQEDYKAEWTHPGKPDPGFVFDFAPAEIVPAVKGKGKGKEVVIDVDAEKEKEGVSTLLVCAQCLDPLLLRADGITEGGEDEVRRRKVWGLRCGHLIDGKCFEELRRPVEDPVPEEDTPAVEADTSTSTDASGSKGKGKGKGKARAVSPEPDEDPDTNLAADASSLFNPIRSRLRSRGSAPIPSLPGAFEIAVPSPPRPKKRAPPKRKGKARPKKPVVEAVYRWVCPVAGCGHEHVSEKIAGVWCNGQGLGAVGVFV